MGDPYLALDQVTHIQITQHKSIYTTNLKTPNKKSTWLKKSLSPPLSKNNWKLSKLKPRKPLLLNPMPAKSERPERVRRRLKNLRKPRRVRRRLPRNLEKPENLKNPERPRNLRKPDEFDDERLPRKLNELNDELPELPTNEPEEDEPSPNA